MTTDHSLKRVLHSPEMGVKHTQEENFMRNSWNFRNGQRANAMRPGTKEYTADFHNTSKQFYSKPTLPGCFACHSTSVVAKGGDGRIFVYCAKCHKQLRVINTKPVRVGQWSKTIIYRQRAGLCAACGYDTFIGTMHVGKNTAHFDLQLTCVHCGQRIEWHKC